MHSERFSTNIVSDCKASKAFADQLCLNTGMSAIKGYIQEIGLDPFGLILFSELQVLKIEIFSFNILKAVFIFLI